MAKRSLENFRASKQVRVGWNEIIRQVFPRLLVDTVGEVLEGRWLVRRWPWGHKEGLVATETHPEARPELEQQWWWGRQGSMTCRPPTGCCTWGAAESGKEGEFHVESWF